MLIVDLSFPAFAKKKSLSYLLAIWGWGSGQMVAAIAQSLRICQRRSPQSQRISSPCVGR